MKFLFTKSRRHPGTEGFYQLEGENLIRIIESNFHIIAQNATNLGNAAGYQLERVELIPEDWTQSQTTIGYKPILAKLHIITTGLPLAHKPASEEQYTSVVSILAPRPAAEYTAAELEAMRSEQHLFAITDAADALRTARQAAASER